MILMDKVTIYTDGSFIQKTGRGGYGAIVKTSQYYEEIYGGFNYTTINRMEMIAVIRSLQSLKSHSEVIIYSDSLYIVKTINTRRVYLWRDWQWIKRMRSIPNSDLWRVILGLLEKHDVTFEWIKGHDSNVYNERCDALAKRGTKISNPEIDEEFMRTFKNNRAVL
jgi:ribonuclease HI